MVRTGNGTMNPSIFHITHWKAGSQWIHRILIGCVRERIVSPQNYNAQFLEVAVQPGKVYPTLYITREEFDRAELPSCWRRFVIIRDLRDTLISGYFSFKISHPESSDELRSWRSVLQSLDVEDGLAWLLDVFIPMCARIQQAWLDSGEPLLRYEDLLRNDIELLEKVLIDHCQLPVSRQCLREHVVASRFENVTNGRQLGQEDVRAHERKGSPGDWRNYFTPRLKELFKAHYGDLLQATGYEKDSGW